MHPEVPQAKPQPDWGAAGERKAHWWLIDTPAGHRVDVKKQFGNTDHSFVLCP